MDDVVNLNRNQNNFYDQIFDYNHNSYHNNQSYDYGELIDPVKEVEEAIMNEVCPNPDNMTYEQLLELQEKTGAVSRGFPKDKIKVFSFNF
jgi:hypothetical protein